MMLLLSLLLSILGSTTATDYELGWSIRPDNLQSLDPQIVYPGDTVRFSWISSHNVWLHRDETCDSAVSELQDTEAREYVHTPTTEDVGKTTFIACNVFGHCEVGLKVAIIVVDSPTFTSDAPGTHDTCLICDPDEDVSNPEAIIFGDFTCSSVIDAGNAGTITSRQCLGLTSSSLSIASTCGCTVPTEGGDGGSNTAALTLLVPAIAFAWTLMTSL